GLSEYSLDPPNDSRVYLVSGRSRPGDSGRTVLWGASARGADPRCRLQCLDLWYELDALVVLRQRCAPRTAHDDELGYSGGEPHHHDHGGGHFPLRLGARTRWVDG